MSQSITILKQKYDQLQEDLMYYKGESIDLRRRIQNLEDENRTLREKLRNHQGKPSRDD